MALINLSGYVFKDDGTAVSGATVQLYQTDSATLVTLSDGSTSTTTDSNGYWSASVTEAGATSGYDVKITSGSSLRKRRGNDRLQIEELDIRNDTGATQGGLLVANTTNSAANKVATFAGRNTTNADNDEIYITFEIHNDADEVTEYARMTAVAIDVTNGSEDGEIQFDVMKAGTLTKVWSISSSTGGATSFDIETSTVTMAVDDFTIKSEDDGSAAILYMFADQGDDNADKWRLQVADGGTMTYSSLISGSYVTHMTITPNSTVASSATTLHGTLTMGSTAALTNAGLVAVANQSNITGVGTISSGTWNGAAIASTYIAADAITGAKIADDAINSEHYTDASIDTAHIAADQIVASLIADDAIDSEHYTDGSIDTAHIGDNQVTLAKMAGGTDGNIISYDASGDPVAIATGSDGQVLTSTGAGSPPAFETPTVGDITGVTAGVGLSGGGTSGALTITLDLSELSTVTPADGDFFSTLDSDGANEQKTTTTALATLFAGDGLQASSSVLSLDLVSNGGLEISSNELQVATGIAQHDIAQYAASVADDDFLRIDGTKVEGLSAAEVAAAIESSIDAVGTIATGVWNGTVIAEAYLPNAAIGAEGVVELATAAEINTSTDAARVMSAGLFSDSNYGIRYVGVVVADSGTALTTGDGKAYFHVPAGLAGMDLMEAHAEVNTAPAGSTIIIEVSKNGNSTQMLTTNITIDAGETGSDSAAALRAYATDGSEAVAENDLIQININQIGSGTAGSGLIVTLGFRIP